MSKYKTKIEEIDSLFKEEARIANIEGYYYYYNFDLDWPDYYVESCPELADRDYEVFELKNKINTSLGIDRKPTIGDIFPKHNK